MQEYVTRNLTWENDDWIEKYSSELVTDKRWEELPTIFSNRQEFRELKHYFSVYRSEKLTFHIHNDTYTEMIKITPKTEDEWIHYKVFKNAGKITILENNYLVHEKNIFKVEDVSITVITPNETFWKMHNYSYREADSISEKSTIVTVPPTGRYCVLIYTSMCDNCFLDVTANQGTNFVISNNESHHQTWHQHVIGIDPNDTTKLYITRRSGYSDNRPVAFKMDLRLCPHTENNKTITSSNVRNSTCMPLKRPKVAQELELNELLCPNKPGKLGQNCDTDCEQVLGPNYKYCEKHRICTNAVCNCAWGYKGPSCQERCETGFWGLNCRNRCEENCVSCNAITGACEAGTVVTAKVVMEVVLLITSMVAVVATGFLMKLIISLLCNRNVQNAGDAPLLKNVVVGS